MTDRMSSEMECCAYHYILTDRDLLKKIDSNFFTIDVLQMCYPIAKAYSLKYLTPPTIEIVLEELRREKEINGELETRIKVVYEKVNNNMDKEYLKEIIINTATWSSLEYALQNASEFAKKNSKTVYEHPEFAKRYRDKVRMMIDAPLSINYEMEETEGSDFWDAKSHVQEVLKRRSTGFEFIDQCMAGGYWDGSFTVFAGAPKVGKSQFLCNLCAQSVLRGYNSMYITLELPEPLVTARIGANIFNIPHADYDKVSQSTEMQSIISNFRKNRPSPLGELIVKSYPTSSMSAEDLESFILKAELARSTETYRFKFQNIFVDYINIMRNPANEYSENTYIKIKNIAEHLKGVGVKNNWAIITATQMNKGQYDKSDAKAEDVAESSGLGATVDLLFGIIRDATCALSNRYYIKCIYDRVAPHQEEKKLYDFDGKYLRLSENKEEGVLSCLVEAQKTYFSASAKYPSKQSVQSVPNNASVIPPAKPIPHDARTNDLMPDTTQATNYNPRAGSAEPIIAPQKSPYTMVDTMPSDNYMEAAPPITARPAPVQQRPVNMFANKNGFK